MITFVLYLQNVLLVFPGPDAKSLDDYVKGSKLSKGDQNNGEVPPKRLCQGLEKEEQSNEEAEFKASW